MREVEGYLRGRQDAEREKQQDEWERARSLAMVFIQPHLKKGAILKPTDVMKFDWDTKPKPIKPASDIKERWAKWDEDMKKRYGK
jgi:hypothetical protein